MKKSLFIATSILLLACNKADNYTDQSVQIIGHAGAGFSSMNNPLPANSLASINRAMALGADGVEIDVKMAADTTLWLYHDRYMEASTNCKGCIGELTGEQLADCRYKTGSSAATYGDYRLLSLDSLLAHYANVQGWPPFLSFDIKYNVCGPEEVLFETLVTTFEPYKDIYKVEFTAFSRQLLTQLKDTFDHPVLLESKAPVSDLEWILDNGFHGVVANELDMTADDIAAYHEVGLKVVLFGATDYFSSKRTLEKGADEVQTDNIELLVEMLD